MNTFIYLVGAGPGHPGYLTLRAVECLTQADLVIYDQLVSARVLEHVPAKAERVCVSALAETHTDRHAHVLRLMVEAASRGKCVVRLKGGDPYVFGRGGEEAEFLRQAGIPYEIVPGITAGIGAAACTEIPLTHRSQASCVAFVTGHEDPDKSADALDWKALARFPGTLVLYMGVARLPQLVRTLLEHGKDPTTPAAVIQWATTPRQRTVEAPLGELAEKARSAGLTAPALILIGSAVALRPRPSWFEQRPLFGKRVLVTRPRRQAGEWMARLEHLGADVFLLPAIEIREPADWSRTDEALAHLSRYHWLAFTSVNGVHAFFRRLRTPGRDLRALGHLKLAVIGPATADALRSYHLEPDLMPKKYCSEGLAEALKPLAAGQRVLLARADRGRDLLEQELSAVAEVERVVVYSQADAVDVGSEAFAMLRRGEIDYVTLTSANIAQALLRALNVEARSHIEAGRVRLVSISPVTSAAIHALGLPVAAEAKEYTLAGVTEALRALASSR